MHLRFYTLWAIKAALDESELYRQLDEMHSLGFDGVVFHPRFYPNEPHYLGDEYLDVLSRAILHAKSLGMEFWIYDENGWPSGTVGGELPGQFPDCRQQWADLVTDEPNNALSHFEHEGREWHLARRYGQGVDYLNPRTAENFLRMTYERYRQGLMPMAFEHVSTFFCDEPEFGLGHAYDALSPHGAIPWTSRLPELFRERYDRDLFEVLPLLFFPVPGHEVARVQFWELLTDLLRESFLAPMDTWCRRYGKRFTAHVKGEEHPLFQVPMVGSSHQVLQSVALPAIDALERFPSGQFFPRQASSIARQFGNGDCMVECFGGAGWGASPQDAERFLNWLTGHGLNHFVLHLWQYRLSSRAIRDWPPSVPVHMNWRDAWPDVIHRVRNRALAPEIQADLLVVAPYRGIMREYDARELLRTNIHNGAAYPDTPAGRMNRRFLSHLDRIHASSVAYHLCDERTVEQHGKLEADRLRLGNCTYSNVAVADDAVIDPQTRRMIEKFAATREFPPIRPSIARAAPGGQCTVEWMLRPHTNNLLVLDSKPDIGPSTFIAYFEARNAMKIHVLFADDVQRVTLNGISLDGNKPATCKVGENRLRFSSCAYLPGSGVWLQGEFSVHTNSPYESGPNGTVCTNGPFFLETPSNANCTNLTANGYPFACEPLVLDGQLDLLRPATRVRLTGVRADCAAVSIDGIDCGWCWGPDWSVAAARTIRPGRHVMTVKLIPSTFNRYGPHHHVDGDPHVVSPMQYEYTKNFADRLDAPTRTRMELWHLKPLGIANLIEWDE